jgi:hypothetical protein
MTLTSGVGGGAAFVAALPPPIAISPMATVASRTPVAVQYVRRRTLDVIAVCRRTSWPFNDVHHLTLFMTHIMYNVKR